MHDLSHKRCFNHGFREAVACCPECGRYFCRECVTEHENRVLCASCLKKLIRTSVRKPFRLGGLIRMVQFLVGALLLWMSFYYLGQILLSLPTSFHEGTVWQGEGWEDR